MRMKYALLKAIDTPFPDESKLSTVWIFGEEVMDILRCTKNTLKTLRKEKIIPYSKIGGRIYYNPVDVQEMFLRFRRLSLA